MGWRRRSSADRGHEDSESDEERRIRAIRETIESHKGDGPDGQAAAVEHLLLAEPSPATTDWLWQVLIGGLMVALVLSLCGVIALAVIGKSNQVLVTVFSSILAGLLGLFVKGPAEGS